MSNVTDLTLFGDAITSTATGIKLDGANALALSAYNKTIGVVAVDAFIYDTSKDSDGGAWRKRTQHTSWYNETLNTATRGSRREFPAVAVIVAESNKVTIYDGDEPDCPMWMVFDVNNEVWIKHTTSGPSSVTMLNATLSTTGSGLEGRLSVINFISDSGYVTETGFTYEHYNISRRNIDSVGSGTGNKLIVNIGCNDVAMTVLPSAPIDSATGLPVPTIAVATDGGVSVIKDDGTVVDITVNNVTYNIMHNVKFSGNDVVFSNANSSQNYPYVRVVPIPSADIAYSFTGSGVTEPLYYIGTEAGWVDSLTLVGVDSSSAIKGIEADGDFRAIGATGGLNLIKENRTTPSKGSVAYITSDYNTGWMNGDIKLATLSDTDATNAVGVEILTNTNFTSGTSPWVAAQAIISSGSNKLTITPDSGVNGGVYDSITTVVGKSYVAQVKVLSDTGSLSRLIAAVSSNINDITTTSLANKINMGAGVHNITFVATATTTYIWLVVGGGSQQATEFDDVSVRLAEPDRSVNGNGLQVFGTVTKTAVATGADLVAYSGFSANNYLQQRDNVINYGSAATICLITWQKITDISTYSYATSLYDTTNATVIGLSINQTAAGNLGCPYLFDTTNGALQSGVRIDDGQWHQVVGVLDGTTKSIYVDGVLRGTETVTAVDFSSVDRVNVGHYTTTGEDRDYHHLGSLALIRHTQTSPTAEQIAKMYNDEKHLFQDNAQATLYGTSDAVKALAYDEKTELLHAGTSQGRSVFQGLRRVDNTTDAVATTISARNQMIAEQ